MTTLYIGNLPFSSTEESIKSHLSACCKVASVKMINDRETGKSKGFAFAEVDDSEKVIANLNGTDFNGRKLVINEARPKEDKPRYDNNDSRRPNYRNR
jgi:RNA recognition motif-containing protein